MNGPLNYYRTTKHNFDEEAGMYNSLSDMYSFHALT